MDVSHRQELPTSSSYCCCCESEFDPALLLKSRHDALDSPSTLCIPVPSPLARGRNNVRELRAQRRRVLGDGGRGSILTASPISYSSKYDRGTCCELLLAVNTWYKYLIRDTCCLRTKRKKKNEPRIRLILHSYKVQNEVTN